MVLSNVDCWSCWFRVRRSFVLSRYFIAVEVLICFAGCKVSTLWALLISGCCYWWHLVRIHVVDQHETFHIWSNVCPVIRDFSHLPFAEFLLCEHYKSVDAAIDDIWSVYVLLTSMKLFTYDQMKFLLVAWWFLCCREKDFL